jgi:thiosulfate dehydrogenase
MTAGFIKYYTIIGLAVIITGCIILYNFLPGLGKYQGKDDTTGEWQAPDIYSIPAGAGGDLVRYGKELIVNTAHYLGPRGAIANISNGMNCQNCHPEAGTRINANCFALVASTYPKFRERSGIKESVQFRINDCFERSLNGRPLDSASREMRALVAYIMWVGKDIHKGDKLKGMGIPEPSLLSRTASIGNGEKLFATKCVSCHGVAGQGLLNPDSTGYVYPPLWGEHSYNISAGMYRISRVAGYIKYNMPYTSIQIEPQLSDDEAWDIAAFISSQDRPKKIFPGDWPKIESKPYDYPFGPFADSFVEAQHKYGPFGVIRKSKEQR